MLWRSASRTRQRAPCGRCTSARAGEALASARPAVPRPDLASRDRGRPAPLSGSRRWLPFLWRVRKWRGRLTSAFDWTTPVAAGPAMRIDGWIDPPPYTRVAPIILALSSAKTTREIKPPVNSTVVVRAANAPGITIVAEGALGEVKTDDKCGRRDQ